jgi:hypothetical protein
MNLIYESMEPAPEAPNVSIFPCALIIFLVLAGYLFIYLFGVGTAPVW